MQTHQEEKATEIGGLFVGSVLCFSDTTMKLVEAEVSCFKFARAASPNEPLFMDDTQAPAMRLIVMGESLAEELVETLPSLRAKFPEANIAYAYRKPKHALKLLQEIDKSPESGQIGFLPMNLSVDSWLSVLRLLMCGENHIPAELIVQHGARQDSDVDVAVVDPVVEAQGGDGENIEKKPERVTCEGDVHLTARELQVLKFAAEGKQNKIIADELELSQHTVKLHMHHVIAKLGLHNRTEAAVWYLGHRAEHQGS